jgi:hypothetical protein
MGPCHFCDLIGHIMHHYHHIGMHYNHQS